MRRFAALGWIPVLVLLGCGSAVAGTSTDPRDGKWVTVAGVEDGSAVVQKICDGNGVLLYIYRYRGGIAAVPDAAECKR